MMTYIIIKKLPIYKALEKIMAVLDVNGHSFAFLRKINDLLIAFSWDFRTIWYPHVD